MWTIPRNQKQQKQKLLELISNYSKVEGYKINIQKSITLLYTNNEQVEFQIKTQTQLPLHPQMKFLGINLTKYVQYPYEENSSLR